MSNVAYSYTIYPEDRVVAIVDEFDPKHPTMTVTNAIDEVINEIIALDDGTVDYRWWFIYMDTEGNIDGYDPLNDRFYHIGARNWTVALQKIKESKQHGS